MTDRHLKWLLLASLLINAVLVGFLAGRVGRGGLPGFDARPAGFMDRGMNRQGGGAVQEILAEAMKAERPAMDRAMRDMQAARARGIEIIRAETLDTAALEQIFSEMRSHNTEALAAFQRAIGAAAAKLDPPRRAALARFLDRVPEDRGRMGPGMTGRMGGDQRGRMGAPPPGPPTP